MKTLLEIAKKKTHPRIHKEVTPQMVELAVAWAKGEISYTQVSSTLGEVRGKTNGNSYAKLARALAKYVKENL